MNKIKSQSVLLVFILLMMSIGTMTTTAETRATDVQGQPLNFEDFPSAFDSSNSLLQWGGDMIDLEKVNSEFPEVTGEDVYVAVLDTGLKKNWRDYFPEERIITEWGKSFVDVGVYGPNYEPRIVESNDFTGEHPHGTHVTSTIIGFNIRGTNIQGVAPQANIIPVKVLNTYESSGANFGTYTAIAAGIDYVTELAENNPDDRFVISMSLGGSGMIVPVLRDSIDAAIDTGVIVVAAAGNAGTEGMDNPGSYGPVISVGASGWAYDSDTGDGEWIIDNTTTGAWWLNDVPEDNSDQSYITEFSGRERTDLFPQELDVVAPGSWVVGPYPIGTGQSHIPWWSEGDGNVGPQYFFVGGTSMATPHVSGIVALMLQVDPTLQQHEVESILKSSADPLPFSGTKYVVHPSEGLTVVSWGLDGYDAVGSGLAQADSAIYHVMS